jgi:hypothetical protein
VSGYINMESLIEVRKEPLISNPSPFVLDSEKATLNIIDKGLYIFSSELPTAAKVAAASPFAALPYYFQTDFAQI